MIKKIVITIDTDKKESYYIDSDHESTEETLAHMLNCIVLLLIQNDTTIEEYVVAKNNMKKEVKKWKDK